MTMRKLREIAITLYSKACSENLHWLSKCMSFSTTASPSDSYGQSENSYSTQQTLLQGPASDASDQEKADSSQQLPDTASSLTAIPPKKGPSSGRGPKGN